LDSVHEVTGSRGNGKLEVLREKRNIIYFTFYLTITKRSCIFAPRFGRNIKGNKQ